MGGLFGLAVLIVWPLVQVPLLLYLARRYDLDFDDADLQERAPREYTVIAEAADAAEACATSGRVCRRCGTENDPSYNYCNNCVAPLVQQAGPSPG